MYHMLVAVGREFSFPFQGRRSHKGWCGGHGQTNNLAGPNIFAGRI